MTTFIYFYRDRRMFGALLGTLQKFRQEETQLKDKVSCITARRIKFMILKEMTIIQLHGEHNFIVCICTLNFN